MTARARRLPSCIGFVLAALAPAGALQAEVVPTAYACTFKSGSSLVYSKSVYRSKKATPITFDIDAINLDGQRAELVSPNGRGPLRIVRAVGANHYLEAVTEGYLNLTTIYQKDDRRGAYPAVHSRHFGVLGEPIVAQYTGFCTAKGEATPAAKTGGKP